MNTITWYGHSAFKIATEKTSIIIDPFFAPSTGIKWQDAGNVDAALVTHDHGDHVGDVISICKNRGAMLGAVVGTAQKLAANGVPERQVLNGIGFNIGGTITYRDIAITMVQAFHSSDSGVPAGYILRLPDGMTIYHAGDTGIFSSMSILGNIYNIRIAMLPMGGVFTMDAIQAANACKLIGCETVIPMHWGTFPVLAQDTREFHDKLQETCPQCSCLEMKPGQEKTL